MGKKHIWERAQYINVPFDMTIRHSIRDVELQLQICFGVQRNGPDKKKTKHRVRFTNVDMVFIHGTGEDLDKYLSLEKAEP